MDFRKLDFEYPATVPQDMESHGGDDVAVFAIGPWAHLFTGTFAFLLIDRKFSGDEKKWIQNVRLGTYEQHFIAEAIKYAMCISPGDKGRFCSGVKKLFPNTVLVAVTLIVLLFAKSWSA